MSNEMTGVVQEVKVKTVAGGKTAYDIVVGGQSYGVGLYAPKCKAGDYVKFEIDDSRGYKNVARNSLKVSANKPPAEALAEAQATAPKQSAAGGTFDLRQDMISRQAASNTAIAFMNLLQSAGALPTAAKGKQQEVLEQMLEQYEKEFYERNTGTAWKDVSPSKKDSGPTPVDEPDVTEDTSATSDEEWK